MSVPLSGSRGYCDLFEPGPCPPFSGSTEPESVILEREIGGLALEIKDFEGEGALGALYQRSDGVYMSLRSLFIEYRSRCQRLENVGLLSENLKHSVSQLMEVIQDRQNNGEFLS